MIPKVFHLVWGNDKPLPDYAEANIAKLRELYPDWEVKVWRDFPHERVTGDAMDVAPNYGARSDIMRMEILWKFGGCYLDVDVEPLEVFPWFDTFTNISCKQGGGVGPHFIAVPPESKAMEGTLSRINQKIALIPTLTQYKTYVWTGPEMCSYVFVSCGNMTLIEHGVIEQYFKHHMAGSWRKSDIPKESVKLVSEANLVGWEESCAQLKKGGCCDPVV
jgi:mannosyltransferase OCH1-like enzyme